MKITRVETVKLWVDWCNWLFVRIDTDEGLSGWGEASLHGAIESVETAIREFATHLIGEDPAGPEQHWHRIYNAWRWRGGAEAARLCEPLAGRRAHAGRRVRGRARSNAAGFHRVQMLALHL
jgi:L-alanine-DL-glutamate epimerase-like enolase superfamily enzyme